MARSSAEDAVVDMLPVMCISNFGRDELKAELTAKGQKKRGRLMARLSEPPVTTLGPLGRAERLNWLNE